MASKGLGGNALLKVTPSDLQTKSSSVSKLVHQMKMQYDSLQKTISSSNSYWIGDGGNAYRSKFREQAADVDEMFRRINEHIVDLEKMAGVYTQTEEKVKAQIQSDLPADVIE